MAWLFLIILLAWPVMEFVAFERVAALIGTPLAILGLFLSAIIGLAVLRGESLGAARAVRAEMSRGQTPLRGLFDNASGAVAGFLLIIPGYVTTALGFLLLLPPVRSLIYGELLFMVRQATKSSDSASSAASPRDVTIIDAEYEVLQSDSDVPPPQASSPSSYSSGGSGAGGPGKPFIRLLL